MDIYLTAKSNGERLRFPLLPDRINVKTGALPVSFQIIKLGEARIPRGTALTGVSWNGVLPGASMKDVSFVFDWQEPNVIVKLLNDWEGRGETLTLMVTETTINADVFIESFTYEHYGVDNVSYTLNLTQRRELYVETVPAPPPEEDDSGSDEDSSSGGKKKKKKKKQKKKKSSKSKSTKKTTATSSTSNTGTKKSLVVNIPTKTLKSAAKQSVKTSVTAYSKTRAYAVTK